MEPCETPALGARKPPPVEPRNAAALGAREPTELTAGPRKLVLVGARKDVADGERAGPAEGARKPETEPEGALNPPLDRVDAPEGALRAPELQ